MLLTRAVAIATAALYMALLVFAWGLNGQAGYDGVLRPQPHDVVGRLAPVKILEVEPGSPADQAGIRAGDQIAAVDGNPFVFDVHQSYHNRRAGSAASLRIISPGEGGSHDVKLTLESRLASPSIVLDLALASLLGIAIIAVGAGVAFIRSDSAAARLLLAVALGLAVSTPSDLWHWTQRDGFAALILDQLSGIVLTLAAAALLHLFLIFPTPNLFFRGLRLVIPVFYALAPLPIVAGALTSSLDVPSVVSTLIVAVLLLGALFALEVSYRRPASPLARAQLGWVRWGLAVGVGAQVLTGLARVVAPDAIPAIVSSLVSMAWLVFPLSIAMAVLRYRLFEVDRVVRTTILWGMLAAIVLTVYLLLVVIVGRLAAGLLGASTDPTLAVVAVLVVAAIGHPLRMRVQSALDGHVYRQRFSRVRLVEHASELASQPRSVDTLVRFLCQEAPRALALSGAWLAVPAERGQVFEAERNALLPNVSLLSSSLVETVARLRAPVLLAAPEDLPAYGGMPVVPTDPAGLRQWYLAGARALVPLHLGSGELLALWLQGASASGDLLDRDDLAALARVAGLVALQLERSAGPTEPAPVVAIADSLTEREREVMALLARGYSNRQIADELIIGVRTAETHVERVLRKLGLDNRAQVIVWAREHAAESPRLR